jgi:hypothetical protein
MTVPEQDSKTAKREELSLGKRLPDTLGFIISMYGNNGGESTELVQNVKVANVTCVQNQVHIGPEIRQAWRHLKRPILEMGIRDQTDGRNDVSSHSKSMEALVRQS